MAQQWNQPGYQYPQQTGFQQPAPTGYSGGGSGFLQPQRTGFAVPNSFTPQQQGPVPPVPPLPQGFQSSFQTQQQQFQPPQQQFVPNNNNLTGPLAQQQRFLSPSPGVTGPLISQPTGIGGGLGLNTARPLIPQPTGYNDPRLQLMSNTFMPGNISQPYAPSGIPQFAPGGFQGNLQQSFQQHNQQQRGTAAPKIPWALSKDERKNYDQIFRAWDTSNSGFISGETASEVFGQSGLDRNDLAQIWTLADADNRGKLNIQEFHVAMGLVYRRLNGNEIPTVLPPELEPVSSKHLGESVDFLKDLLKNDTNIRATSSDSRGKVHSFRDSPTPQVDPTKDGTIYKHDDAGVRGYTSGSRRIDRNAVRSGDSTPSDDLSDIKRQLASTNKRLDKAREEAESRTAEDDALDNELDDLKYRVRRVQDDIEHVSRGPKSPAKDQERRRLERVLLELMHTKVPELEKKIEERDRRKQREVEEWTRDRDRRNDRHRGKYDSPSSPRSYRDEDEEEEPDRGYLRGTFNRDDERRDSGRRDSGRRSVDQDDDRARGYDRSRIRNRDRGSDRVSPPLPTRSPAPVPRKNASSTPRPAAPVPSASPAPQTKSMTPDERAAFIRAQAQQRLQERMKALGVSGAPPSNTSPVDTSVEARLANERKEAEEKARKAEKDAEDREKLRQQRLEVERAARSPVAPVAPKTTTPVTVPPVPKPAPPPPASKRAPRPPPPPRSSNSSNSGSAVSSVTLPRPPAPRVPAAPPAPVVPPAPPVAEDDEEERELRRRETARQEADRRRLARRAELEAAEEAARREAEEREIREREAAKEEADKLRAARRAELEAAEARQAEERERREREAVKEEAAKRRAARLAELEAAEAEARKEEEEYEKRMEALRNAKLKVASAPSQNGHVAPVHATPPPPAPPAPPAPVATPVPSPGVQTTNPFHKLSQQISANTPSPGPSPAANPWSSTTSSETVSAPLAPPPPPVPPVPPAPPAPSVVPVAPPAPSAPSPPLVKTPTPVSTNPYSTPKSAYIPPPVDDWDDPVEKEDSDSSDDEFVGRDARINIANAIFRGGSGTPAPSAPPPPKSPAPFKALEGPPDRNALLSSIVGGAKLRPAKTNDRSSAAVAGAVVGDSAPPSHISATARPVTPPTPGSGTGTVSGGRTPSQVSESRQSVDWYAGLAADGLPRSVSSSATHETPINEEDEGSLHSITIPDISVHGPTESAHSDSTHVSGNLMADINTSISHRVRTLYAYTGQRAEDIAFDENVVLSAHPSKSGSDWWYGTLVKNNQKGFFPSSYVTIIDQALDAKALYTYVGGTADELPFAEGNVLSIVDRSEGDWWKAEKDGVIFIVPAAYFELLGASDMARPFPNAPSASAPYSGLNSDGSKVDASLNHIDPGIERAGAKPSDGGVHITDDSDTSDYRSFDSDSDPEREGEDGGEAETPSAADLRRREDERRRVLEAAGLIIMHDTSTLPPVPPRRRPSRKRVGRGKTLPPVPRLKKSGSNNEERELPPPPPPSIDSILRDDDAFSRYEQFKQQQPNTNRFSVVSVASVETAAGSPPSISHSLAPSLTRESDAGKTSNSLLSFFGLGSTQITAPTSGERRTANISGPIITAIDPSISRENSPTPSFAISWSSLVDKSVLDEIPAGERKRQEAMFELINTEGAYVRDLQLVVETFYAPLLNILNEQESSGVFGNIEEILLCNTAFLSSLEERQRDSRLYIDNVGDILRAHIPNFKIYSDYCTKHGPAIKLLQSLRSARPDLDAQLTTLRNGPEARNLDLSSYLLIPMQRITRYPLLMRQILSNTPPDRDRSNIEAAISKVEAILEDINEHIREREGQERLAVISKDLWIGQGRLDLTATTRYMGPRKLLKEGILCKSKSGRELRVFLCSDILVLTDAAARSLYRMPIPLSEMQVAQIGHQKDEFQVSVLYPRGGDAIRLRAPTPRSCQEWINAMNSAVTQCRNAARVATHAH